MSDEDDAGYGDYMTDHSITQMEHDAMLAELETASVERCREIGRMLLKRVSVYGYAKYDSSFGDDRICECDHPYYRHFDSYENMKPVGCKYCYCHAFVEKGTDRDKWKKLNPDV